MHIESNDGEWMYFSMTGLSIYMDLLPTPFIGTRVITLKIFLCGLH